MKKIFFAILFGFFVFVTISSQAHSNVITISIPVEPSPTPEDYEKALNHLKKTSVKAFKYDSWKDVDFIDRKTKVKKKFGDFSNLEQNFFMLDFAEKLTDNMTLLQKAWDEELELFANPKHVLVPRPVIQKQKQNPARKADVEEYYKQLLDLRKKFAVEYEEFAECFLNCECKITEKEREYTLRLIRKANDAHNLIERKKE